MDKKEAEGGEAQEDGNYANWNWRRGFQNSMGKFEGLKGFLGRIEGHGRLNGEAGIRKSIFVFC